MEIFRSLNYPPVVFWEVTDQCDHNCIHCFNYWRTGAEPTQKCITDGKDYLNIARKIISRQPVRVIFTGGEPFLVFEKLVPAIEQFSLQGISMSFNSNTGLLNEEIAVYLREKRISLFISFPSAKELEFDQITDTEGAYQKVLAAADMLYSVGVRFSFNMVVSRINLHSIFYTAEFLKERYSIRNISVTRVSEPINAGRQFDQYLLSSDDLRFYMRECIQIEHELGIHVTAASPFTPCSLCSQDEFDLFAFEGSCEAGKISYVVTPGGTVRACARDSKEYGDLLTEPFDEIWGRMLEWRDESFIPSSCGDCEQRSLCRGGCRVDGLPKCGTRDRLDNYSDPGSLPIKFVKTPPYFPDWGFTAAFRVPKDVHYAEEEFGIRISRRGAYSYCTRVYSDFLNRNERFTLDEFCRFFDLELEQAKQIIGVMYNKGILLAENGKEQ